MIKKLFTKVLCSVAVISNLVSVGVNAYSLAPGWYKHCQTDNYGGYSWEYVKEDGTNAVGWNYINGNWYYFDQYDCSTYTGRCWYDSNGILCGDIPNSLIEINGDAYYFDNNGRMLHDCNVYSKRGIIYHLDNNGHPVRV